MLAANYPSEDHIHEPVRALDPDGLPPRPDPILPRLFLEQCECGAVQAVDEAGVSAGPWFLTAWRPKPTGDGRPEPQDA